MGDSPGTRTEKYNLGVMERNNVRIEARRKAHEEAMSHQILRGDISTLKSRLVGIDRMPLDEYLEQISKDAKYIYETVTKKLKSMEKEYDEIVDEKDFAKGKYALSITTNIDPPEMRRIVATMQLASKKEKEFRSDLEELRLSIELYHKEIDDIVSEHLIEVVRGVDDIREKAELVGKILSWELGKSLFSMSNSLSRKILFADSKLRIEVTKALEPYFDESILDDIYGNNPTLILLYYNTLRHPNKSAEVIANKFPLPTREDLSPFSSFSDEEFLVLGVIEGEKITFRCALKETLLVYYEKLLFNELPMYVYLGRKNNFYVEIPVNHGIFVSLSSFNTIMDEIKRESDYLLVVYLVFHDKKYVSDGTTQREEPIYLLGRVERFPR